MRPTLLQLKSPKERTEYTTNPQVHYNGRSLFHHTLTKLDTGEREPQKKTFAFAPSDRFFYYKYQEERLPKTLGPGTYNDDAQFKKLAAAPCPAIVKHHKNHEDEHGKGNTYYLDGGLLTKDTHAPKMYGRPAHTADPESQSCARRSRRRNINTSGTMGAGGFGLSTGNSMNLSTEMSPRRILSPEN